MKKRADHALFDEFRKGLDFAGIPFPTVGEGILNLSVDAPGPRPSSFLLDCRILRGSKKGNLVAWGNLLMKGPVIAVHPATRQVEKKFALHPAAFMTAELAVHHVAQTWKKAKDFGLASGHSGQSMRDRMLSFEKESDE